MVSFWAYLQISVPGTYLYTDKTYYENEVFETTATALITGTYVQKTASSLNWFPDKLLKIWSISFNACHIQYKVYPFGVKWLTRPAKLTECFAVVCFSQANDSDNLPGKFIGTSSNFPLDILQLIVYKIKRYKMWTIRCLSCKRIFMKYILCSSLFISSRFPVWVFVGSV